MQQPLEDVKILDLSHALAGPFCSTMLGDFGARVVKLEVPGAGDISRAWGPPFYHTEAAYFVSLHRNKQSIEVDLKHPQGKELFFRLVEQCEVVLENFRVGTLQKNWALTTSAGESETPALSIARYRALDRPGRTATAPPWTSLCRLKVV